MATDQTLVSRQQSCPTRLRRMPPAAHHDKLTLVKLALRLLIAEVVHEGGL